MKVFSYTNQPTWTKLPPSLRAKHACHGLRQGGNDAEHRCASRRQSMDEGIHLGKLRLLSTATPPAQGPMYTAGRRNADLKACRYGVR